MPIRLEILDDTGEVVEEQQLMLFHADFFHYAHNFSIPTEGDYTLRATLQPPEFTRHGESLEELTLLEPVTVTFEDVHLESAA